MEQLRCKNIRLKHGQQERCNALLLEYERLEGAIQIQCWKRVCQHINEFYLTEEARSDVDSILVG